MTGARQVRTVSGWLGAAGVLAAAWSLPGIVWAQSGPSPQAARTEARRSGPYPQQRVTDKAKKYYAGAWGVDMMKVSYASSGNLIRFSYRVSDAELAKPLGSKDETPVLIGVRSRAVLQIPVMDKVGPLRQATPPKAGQEYWMMFSNKGNLVRRGDRVNVVIGKFRADGLVVE